MVTVNFRGRLGNNMFQYCLGRILAETLGYKLNSPAIEGFVGTHDTVDGIIPSNYSINLEGHVVDLNAVINHPDKPQIVLDGFFQRYEYYRNHKEKIREWMRIDDYNVGQTENDIIVHVRLGDDINEFHPDHPYIMPLDYYDQVLINIDFDRLYLCSEPETIESKYIKQFDKYDPIILHGDTLQDLRAIKSFDKIIVSQSTFSWWGAFLSNASEIYMPVPVCGHARNQRRYVFPNEWSIARPDIALFVDDEDRYKYVKQYEDRWSFVNLRDIEER